MILRRIAKGIKEQDWFVVSVEVAIVVVGIFIGMQVTDWNEDRKNQAEATQYIDRVLTDIEASIENQELTLRRYEHRIAELKSALDMMSTGKVTEETRAAFSHKVLQIYDWQRMVIIGGTLDELLSTGKLSNINSPEVRNRISEFHTWNGANDGRVNNLVTSLMSDFNALVPLLDRPYGELLLRNPLSDFQDHTLIFRHVRSAIDVHEALLLWNKQFHEVTISFRDFLQTEGARPQ